MYDITDTIWTTVIICAIIMLLMLITSTCYYCYENKCVVNRYVGVATDDFSDTKYYLKYSGKNYTPKNIVRYLCRLQKKCTNLWRL